MAVMINVLMISDEVMSFGLPTHHNVLSCEALFFFLHGRVPVVIIFSFTMMRFLQYTAAVVYHDQGRFHSVGLRSTSSLRYSERMCGSCGLQAGLKLPSCISCTYDTNFFSDFGNRPKNFLVNCKLCVHDIITLVTLL